MPNSLLLKSLDVHFPGSLYLNKLVRRVDHMLSPIPRVSDPSKRLLNFSVCSDELNRPLEKVFARKNLTSMYFSMGGLAGFPFSGLTGFAAMCSHIPDDGHCLWIYSSHVGLSRDGKVGYVPRHGINKIATSCGSAVAAGNYIVTHKNQDPPRVAPGEEFPMDMQQTRVVRMLMKHSNEIMDPNKDMMVTLPYAVYEEIDKFVLKILEHSPPVRCPIVLLGGIQINTPEEDSDYFVPKRFELIYDQQEKPICLLDGLFKEIH